MAALDTVGHEGEAALDAAGLEGLSSADLDGCIFEDGAQKSMQTFMAISFRVRLTP